MKRIEFDNMPAGTVVLFKKYSLWKRFMAKLKNEQLPYNGILVDPFGDSTFVFIRGWFYRYDVFAFTPKKPYSKKEASRLLRDLDLFGDPEEVALSINLVRPNTLTGVTLEEMFENNKYYNKQQMK